MSHDKIDSDHVKKLIIISMILMASTAEADEKYITIDKDNVTMTAPLLFYDKAVATEVTFTSIESDYRTVCFDLIGDTKRCIGLNELYRLLVIRDANKEGTK